MRVDYRMGRTYDGGEEANVGLGEAIADEVVFAGEHFLEPVERLEERVDGSFIRGLRAREPRLVHAVYMDTAPQNDPTA